MRLSIRVTPLALATALVATVASCGPRPMDPAPNGHGFLPPAQPVSCPGFVLETTDINVTPAGGRFAIGPDHTIEFWPGAVSAPATYRVKKGDKATTPPYWAQVEIQPMNGAPSRFRADVMLDLSYVSCPNLDAADGEIQLLKTSPPRKGLGGRDEPVRRALRALLPHLSMFAIAQ